MVNRPGPIIVATMNGHKSRELRAFLSEFPVQVSSLADVPGAQTPEENGATFSENALIKARSAFRLSGQTALADDSGLEVFYLNGRPGIHSARYAGPGATDEMNNEKLLQQIRGVPPRRRGARFVAVLALVGSGIEQVTIGMCSGTIGESPKGTGGFGYDPLFVPDGFARTFAELSEEEKNSISHRSRAFDGMRPILREFLR